MSIELLFAKYKAGVQEEGPGTRPSNVGSDTDHSDTGDTGQVCADRTIVTLFQFTVQV